MIENYGKVLPLPLKLFGIVYEKSPVSFLGWTNEKLASTCKFFRYIVLKLFAAAFVSLPNPIRDSLLSLRTLFWIS